MTKTVTKILLAFLKDTSGAARSANGAPGLHGLSEHQLRDVALTRNDVIGQRSRSLSLIAAKRAGNW